MLVPQVETTEEVRTAAAATRFTYVGGPGERGVGSTRATRWGGDLDAGYPDRADDAVTFDLMTQSRQTVENLESSLAVPGLGVALLGHYDLAVSLGAADPAASSVREHVDQFERACRSADVPFSQHVGVDADATDNAVAAGYCLLLAGDETAAVRDRYGGLLADR